MKYLIILLVLLAPTAQAALIIDSFTMGDATATDSTDGGIGVTIDDTFCGATCIGEYRDINANRVSTNFPGPGSTALSIGSGSLQFNNDAGVIGTGYVQWDGLAGAGLGSIDFAAEGNAFLFSVLAVDLGFAVNFTVEDFGGTSFTEMLVSGINVPADVPSPLEVVVPFSVFTDAGVDMTMVDLLRLEFNVEEIASLDLAVDTITTVPAPGPLTLLGLGLLGLGIMRRRVA